MESTSFLHITVNGEITVVDIPREDLHRKVHEFIDCELFEIVYLSNYGDLVMIVDESGKLYDKRVNPLASLLYSETVCGDFIVGDVLLGKMTNIDGEFDITGLYTPAIIYFTNYLTKFKESYYGKQ